MPTIEKLYAGMLDATANGKSHGIGREDCEFAEYALTQVDRLRAGLLSLGGREKDVQGVLRKLRQGAASYRRRARHAKARNASVQKYGVSFRQRVAERDGLKCKVCGFDVTVHAHHIVPISEDGPDESENGIMLCPHCHSLAHAGRLTAQSLYALISVTSAHGASSVIGNEASCGV